MWFFFRNAYFHIFFGGGKVSDKLYIVSDEAYTLHLTGLGHPECPARYTAITESLKKAGLQMDENTLSPRKATLDEILLCHTQDYYRTVEQDVRKASESEITEGSFTLSTGDVQICPESLRIALLAAGAVLEGVDAVFEEKAKRVFCTIRPPGHHACHDRGMGFCLFNNVAIGARYAQNRYGIKRVLIVDWDVHHGNGTQDIFEEDPSVFYFSTHNSRNYPGTGSESEKSNILNCPILPTLDARLEVLDAFRTKLPKAMTEFKPHFVMISAGFDAHRDDPLGGFNLVDEDYGTLTQIMMQIANEHCQGRIISVLEGGYNLQALASSAVKHVESLVKLSQ